MSRKVETLYYMKSNGFILKKRCSVFPDGRGWLLCEKTSRGIRELFIGKKSMKTIGDTTYRNTFFVESETMKRLYAEQKKKRYSAANAGAGI